MNAVRELNDPPRMTLRKLIGLRIVRARRRRGWSQEALARRMEVPRCAIGRWERGIVAPSLEALMKLAEVLEATTDELLRGRAATQIPPGQRSEATKCLNGFLRAVGWSLPAQGKAQREE